jgi:hypothetical protein
MQATKYLIISMRRTGGTLVNNLLEGHPERWSTFNSRRVDQHLFARVHARATALQITSGNR